MILTSLLLFLFFIGLNHHHSYSFDYSAVSIQRPDPPSPGAFTSAKPAPKSNPVAGAMNAPTTNFLDSGVVSTGNSLALVAAKTDNSLTLVAAQTDNALALVPHFDLADVIMNDEGLHRKHTRTEIPPVPSSDDSNLTIESNWEWGQP